MAKPHGSAVEVTVTVNPCSTKRRSVNAAHERVMARLTSSTASRHKSLVKLRYTASEPWVPLSRVVSAISRSAGVRSSSHPGSLSRSFAGLSKTWTRSAWSGRGVVSGSLGESAPMQPASDMRARSTTTGTHRMPAECGIANHGDQSQATRTPGVYTLHCTHGWHRCLARRHDERGHRAGRCPQVINTPLASQCNDDHRWLRGRATYA